MALSLPERHQLRIAFDTLKMGDAGELIIGGPSKLEAQATIARLTGVQPHQHHGTSDVGGVCFGDCIRPK